jgi:eukaryotic-like serine/threonine-protein kinase
LRLTPTSNLDPDTLRRIAEFSNADTVVYGQYAKFGDQIRIDATLQDRKRNRTEPLKIEAASEKDIPGTVDKLAELIRSHLSLSSDVLKELKASSFQPSSKSAPALRDYNQAVQLLRDGKNIEAVKALEASVQEDPQFALAYSRLAEANAALGYDAQAETDSRKALELSAQLPLAEKYLIEANHARIMKDNKKAIEAYENLAKTFPDNADVEYTLGTLYMDKGDYEKARGEFTKVLQADPKNVKALWQMGVVDINKDNPQAALDPLNKGLSLAIQVDNQEQKALLLHAIGVAYRGMNKPDEAMRNYKESMEINKRIGVKRALAANYVEMGVVQNSLGKPDDALASFTQALNLQREIGIKKEMGFTLIDIASVYQDRGQYDKALQNLKESLQIQRDTGDEENQALCLNDIGSVYLSRGDSDNALTYFQQALQLREKRNDPSGTADVLHGLGTTYAAMGQYDQALTTFVKAVELWRKAGDTRGAAYESHQIGLVFQYQGRYGASVSAMQDAVKSLHEVNDRSRDTAETLYDLADTLAKAGRGAETSQPLEEAQSIARELKNDSLQASILNTQGDVQYYRGDFAAARPLYEQAVKAAMRGSEQKMVLISKLNLARLTAAQGHSGTAINELRSLSQQADSQGLKSIAVSSAVDFAAAMISNKDYAGAKQELSRQLTNSEKLGLRVETARIHYLNGVLAKQAGDTGEAASQFKQTLAILDEVKKEAGAEKILVRPDLKLIYEQSTQGSGGAKS